MILRKKNEAHDISKKESHPTPYAQHREMEEGNSSGKKGKQRGGLPPHHPMHPSQFSGDKYDGRAMKTLIGAFCVMVCCCQPWVCAGWLVVPIQTSSQPPMWHHSTGCM
jgi:hypothetical protein